MAGTDYVPVIQLLCKLQILQGRQSLLPPKLQTRSFLLSLGTEEASGLFFRISHTCGDSKLPNSQCFPRRFGLKQVKKVYSKFASEGKITLELVNFNVYAAQPISTLILVSEASPDGVCTLVSYFSPSVPCLSALRLPPSPLLGLSLDIFALLYACLGPVEGKKLRLVNKRLYSQVGEVARKLTICKGADTELVLRVMGRCKGLRELALQGYKGAVTGLAGLLKARTGLVSLDLQDCRLPDSFLAAVSPSTLLELRLTGFSAAALAAFLPSCLCIRSLHLAEIQLNSVLFQTLQTLPVLTVLSIRYTGLTSALLYLPTWSSCLSSVSCLPSTSFPVLSPALHGLWTSLVPCNLQEVGCDMDINTGFGSMFSRVRTLWSCSLPLQPLPNLGFWTVYIGGEDMLEWLEVYGAWLSRLHRLIVIVQNDWLVPALSRKLGQILGKGKAAVKVAQKREKKDSVSDAKW